MMEMMNRASQREHPAFEKTQYISRVNNPKTGHQEVLIKTEKELAQSIYKFFPDTRKSSGQQSHHVFPQAHRDFFENAGIKIDDYTVLLDQTSHLQMTNVREGYKNAWKSFVDECKESELSPAEIKQAALHHAGTLMTAFGFNDGDINRHRHHNY